MKVVFGVQKLESPLQNSVVTIGNFDGVHLGHQTLIQKVVDEARAAGSASVIMTFWPHPREVIFPDKPFQRLMDVEFQTEIFEQMDADYLIREPFRRDLSSQKPETFLNGWILKPLRPSRVVVGYDFSFGANREGNLDFLKSFFTQHQIPVEIMPPIQLGSTIVSSTEIRRALESGDVVRARQMLSRPHLLEGTVVRGEGRGSRIGIPTANLQVLGVMKPGNGVYATYAEWRGQLYPSITNIGVKPTFQNDFKESQVETHFLDQKLDLYGCRLRLHFLKKLRDEKKFNSVEELIDQIKNDIQTVRIFFEEGTSL